jgi:hypothetical protein
VYGTKTAPKDYQDLVEERMKKLNFVRLNFCSCIYYRYNKSTNNIIYVYDYVDDFICGGNDTAATESFITNEFRKLVTTTDEIKNTSKVLGMELSYDKQKNIILLKWNSELTNWHKSFLMQ